MDLVLVDDLQQRHSAHAAQLLVTNMLPLDLEQPNYCAWVYYVLLELGLVVVNVERYDSQHFY